MGKFGFEAGKKIFEISGGQDGFLFLIFGEGEKVVGREGDEDGSFAFFFLFDQAKTGQGFGHCIDVGAFDFGGRA